MDKLLEFLEKTDFYTAPASTRFHGAYEGGLLEHSLKVYEILVEKSKNTHLKEIQVSERYYKNSSIIALLYAKLTFIK